MDFKQRLQQATERGQSTRSARVDAAMEKALSEEEYRRIHSRLRLPLTEHIEECLRQLGDNFPVFRYETIVDEKGWGGAVNRDDLYLKLGRRENHFSRLQILVSPANKFHVFEIAAKGMVRNKEVFTRNHYTELDQFNEKPFRDLIETWVLNYAELYSSSF